MKIEKHSFEGSTNLGAPCNICDMAITHPIHLEADKVLKEFLSRATAMED